jgi:transketolase
MLDPKSLKKRIIEVAYFANKGHLGSALSVSDLIVSVFNLMLQDKNLNEEKNSLTLSKGHAALALYCCLADLKLISEEELMSYELDGSLLGTHPDPLLPWVKFLGGSLGQGFAFAAGAALSDRFADNDRIHYVILSDSELNAGVVWEIATIAGTKKLNNFVVVLDNNKQQALDLTANILKYEDIATSFQVLGWSVTKVDGHDQNEITAALRKKSDKPHLIIADTKFGAGISFMDGNIAWHYLPLSKELYEKAISEIEVMN